MSSLLQLEGMHAQDVGTVLAAILAASSRPATRILEDLSGAPLHIKVLASGERPLTDREQYRLHAEGLLQCRYRHGREDRRAMATTGIEEVTGADAAARSSAVLMVEGQAVAIAEEHITRQFAETLA
jgi:hypothetical protein